MFNFNPAGGTSTSFNFGFESEKETEKPNPLGKKTKVAKGLINFYAFQEFHNRYNEIEPIPLNEPPEVELKLWRFNNAGNFAKSLTIEKNTIGSAILTGNFIFGDLLERLITEKNFKVKEMYVSTLSFDFRYNKLTKKASSTNLDMLEWLLESDSVECINLMLSRYFDSEASSLIILIMTKLDRFNTKERIRFKYACTDTHIKAWNFETECGLFVNITGSANMRSSRCLEQITLIESAKMYYEYKAVFEVIIDKYSVINHNIPYCDIAKKMQEFNENKKKGDSSPIKKVGFKDMNSFATDPTHTRIFREKTEKELVQDYILELLNSNESKEKVSLEIANLIFD